MAGLETRPISPIVNPQIDGQPHLDGTIKANVRLTHGGVGAGHESFAQILEKAFAQAGITSETYNARLDAKSPLTRAYWNAVNAAYEMGGKGGLWTKGYGLVRDGAKDSITPLRLLKRGALYIAQTDLRNELSSFDGLTFATHAHTAVKTGDNPLVLLQGDLFGHEYANHQADLIVVPMEASKREVAGYGVSEENIETVGFFVDPRVKDPDVINKRMDQLSQGERIHLGILFSGARPAPHVKLVRDRLLPNLIPLLRSGRIQLSIYTVNDRDLGERFLAYSESQNLHTTRFGDDALDGNWDLQVIYGQTMRDANERLFAVVGDPDNPVSVAASMFNERAWWTACLALFPFKPINPVTDGNNTQFAIQHGFAPIPEATEHLPTILAGKKFPELEARRQNAQKILPLNGAENAVRIIKERFSEKAA